MNPLMESTLRPMRPEETARLRTAGKVRPYWGIAFFATLLIGGGVQLLGWLAFSAGLLSRQTADRVTNLLLVVAVPGTFVYWLAKEIHCARRSADAARRRYAADLAANQVEEWRVRIVDAIEVEELEDEGRNFYLELEDSRVLFLSGQYLYDSDEDDEDDETTPRFPNRDLLITRLPHCGEILDLQRLGDHFPPSVTAPPFTIDDHEHDRVPEDGQILPGPLSRYAMR